MGWRGRRTNWQLVLSNLVEAREELQRLERMAGGARSRGGSPRSDGVLGVGLGHAFHHLNAAWRARKWSMARYRKMTNRDFARLSQWPKDLWIPGKDEP